MRTDGILKAGIGVLLVTSVALCGSDSSRHSPTTCSGHFGGALDGHHVAEAGGRESYSRAPLTVECWARLASRSQFNILVANESKESGAHWEIYSYAGTGAFSAYLPGYSPAEIKSPVEITDNQWHYLAMLFDGQSVRLFVDGREAVSEKVARNQMAPQPGPLAFGTVPGESRQFQCDGLIDEVRISRGIRDVTTIPKEPLTADKGTIGLWHLDEVGPAGELADAASGNPARVDVNAGRSLDELDAEAFAAGASPITRTREAYLQLDELKFAPGEAESPAGAPLLSLDGTWEMAEGGAESERLQGASWSDAIPATVPGSVHSALQLAGKIPDPKFGRNDRMAHDASFRTYWLRRSFARPAAPANMPWRLTFGGVAVRCTVWLNGRKLGSHDGMFGGPEFELPPDLPDSNTVTVRIDPAPGKREEWNNPAWRETVVFNNVYGWHYSSIPALGIWRPVTLRGQPAVRMESPFVATRFAEEGLIELVARLAGPAGGWSGKLVGTIRGANFTLSPSRFEIPVRSDSAEAGVHKRLSLAAPRLWWPNDLGEPNLYRLTLSFVPDGEGLADTHVLTFGVRTIDMQPLPGGPRPNQYNWTFVINGRPTFIKGAGWCTMDSSMDFSRERYDRFLSLARLQHVQMLRAWGAGMPEADEFFDLCDRKGLLVLQEWPTAWNSHQAQPYELLEETVRLNTLRLRNHPSLAMWGGGNESDRPVGKAIDMMGRLATELDGTRPFHRAEPWGGSLHNYDCYWGRQPLDRNLTMVASFFGEFGLACMPDVESVLRYVPQEEQQVWPPPPDGSIAHHTPIFNTAEDMSRLMQYSAQFAPADNLKNFVFGSQLSQVVGVRHTLERARTRWPDCSGALYYKMNDNYPAASWSCIDWYGAPKMSHYFFQDSFAPLHGCVLFDSVDCVGKALSLPVYLLDDAGIADQRRREVSVRAYDGQLRLVKSKAFAADGPSSRVARLGEFTLSPVETNTIPLFIRVDVQLAGQPADRTFYWVNYQPVQGSLLTLPRTKLALSRQEEAITISNVGDLPALGVQVSCPGHLDTFTADDNYFWLDPGESRQVRVNSVSGLEVEAWNGDRVSTAK